MTAPLFASILVSGADARTFLQGQLTCDVDSLAADKPLLASLNSAQGRVQAVVNVFERSDGIELIVAASMAERTIQRLRKYILRSKVKIDAGSAIEVSPPIPDLLSGVRAGFPIVFPETYESFVAQMLNLDLVGGISFEKGCYTGQEIIARAHFRGAVKRRMFRFAVESSPPAPGTRVLANGEHAGEVVYAAGTAHGCELLAVVSLAHADSPLTIEHSLAALSKLTLPYSI